MLKSAAAVLFSVSSSFSAFRSERRTTDTAGSGHYQNVVNRLHARPHWGHHGVGQSSARVFVFSALRYVRLTQVSSGSQEAHTGTDLLQGRSGGDQEPARDQSGHLVLELGQPICLVLHPAQTNTLWVSQRQTFVPNIVFLCVRVLCVHDNPAAAAGGDGL